MKTSNISLFYCGEHVGSLSEDEFLNLYARDEHRLLVESGTISLDELIDLMNEELFAVSGHGDYRYGKE